MSKIIHYIFCTYNRKNILTGSIAEDLESMFSDICKEKGLKIICKSILADHVHLLISKKSNDRNEYAMKIIKGISSYRIFKNHSLDRKEFRKLWGRGYRAKSIKNKQYLNRTIKYIQEQKIDGIDKRFIKNKSVEAKFGSRDVQSQASSKTRKPAAVSFLYVSGFGGQVPISKRTVKQL